MVKIKLALIVIVFGLTACQANVSNSEASTLKAGSGMSPERSETKASEPVRTPTMSQNSSSVPRGESQQEGLWAGNWVMGSWNEPQKIGKSARLSIKSLSDSRFEFSIDAASVTYVMNDKGEKHINPHMGQIEGIAVLEPTNEATCVVSDRSFPDYQITFKMTSERTIEVLELNAKTGSDYGRSPAAGLGVRYSGLYTRKQ